MSATTTQLDLATLEHVRARLNRRAEIYERVLAKQPSDEYCEGSALGSRDQVDLVDEIIREVRGIYRPSKAELDELTALICGVDR